MSSLTLKRQPELSKFDSRRHRCKAKPPAYDGPLAAKEITQDKRADSVNEKWPENLACCYKRIYLKARAAHDSFPLRPQSCIFRNWSRLGLKMYIFLTLEYTSLQKNLSVDNECKCQILYFKEVFTFLSALKTIGVIRPESVLTATLTSTLWFLKEEIFTMNKVA